MKSNLIFLCLFSIFPVLANDVILEKDGVTLTDDEVFAAANDLSQGELSDMAKSPTIWQGFIEQQFDNKVMAAGISKELESDRDYAALKALALAKFTNGYYIKKKTFEKINAVKDFTVLAKQTYQADIKKYQKPQTADYYHILFIKNESVDNKAKAESLLSEIKADKLTLAEAAKQYYSSVSGTNEDGLLLNVDDKKLMEPIQKAIFGMPVGAISNVVETKVGYHIIGLKAINEAETIPYNDKIEGEIIANIKNDIYRTVDKEIRDKYRGPENLTVDSDLLESVSQQVLTPKK